MATLNGIAENIAFALGDQFNQTLLQSIKDSIINHRATLIRQDLDNNPLNYIGYLQTFCIELEKVQKGECPSLVTCERVLKSKEKVPTPLRLKSNGRINYKFVGTVDRSVALTFETSHGFNYMAYLPFQNNVIYYTVINNYLYVLNNLKLCKLVIETIVADPRDINDCDFPNTFVDDTEFPIPEDMIAKVKQLIKKEYPTMINDGKEVEITKDDRN